MIETALVSHLRANAQVAALIGERVFPLMIPQHAYDEATKLPCLVYQRIGTQRTPLFCETDSTIRCSYYISCYARSYIKAKELAAEVRDALMDFTGIMGSGAATADVKKILSESEGDLEDPEPGLYRVLQTWTIWFVEV